MIPRALAGLFIASGLASAQLQVFIVEGNAERAAGSFVDVGSAFAGDDLDTRFRARNAGVAAVSVHTISAAGAGFGITGAPSLPASLAPGGSVDFSVRFSPPAYGSYSAVLYVNALSVLLRGSSPAVATVSVEQNGANVTLTSRSVVDFGSVERESSASLRFTLRNDTLAELPVARITVDGCFSVKTPAPLVLAPGDAFSSDVQFSPEVPGPVDATLNIDGRAFRLHGIGLDYPFPPLRLSVDPASLVSGRQIRVTLEFAEAPRSEATGHLYLDFEPAVELSPDDPAILFVDTGARSISFIAAKGDPRVQFEESQETVLQTGTTAGAIVLTARIGAVTETVSLAIPSAPVSYDSIQALRTATGVDVVIAGFDNTRSASQLAFYFFDPAGKAIGAEAIRLTAAADFRRYFETSSTGGAFQLRASFPIAGDASQVSGVEVEIGNLAGVARSERIRF